MRKLVIIIFVIIVVVTGVFFLSNNRNKAEADVPQIIEAKPERGPIVLSVASTGRVVANLDVEIKCKASGEVIGLPYDVSDVVKEGELVVELDPIDEQRNVDKAKVALLATEARQKKAAQNLEIAKSDLKNAQKKADLALEVAEARAKDERAKADRVKQLYEMKLAGLEELETAETAAVKAEADLETANIQIEELETDEAALELTRQDVFLAKSDVESARINLAIAEQRLTDTKVYAPIDGVVTGRDVQTGQIISSGTSNVGGGTTVLTISDFSRLFVIASVDESDIGNVRDGQRVMITADAYPMVRFDGDIERIAQKGVNQSNVVTFEVRIEVKSDNKSLLKPEMTANVDIVVAEKDDVLMIPVGAVSRHGRKSTVSVLKADGTIEEREIEVGINNGEIVEIISGLSEEDTILINEGAAFSQWRSDSHNSTTSPRRMMGIPRR